MAKDYTDCQGSGQGAFSWFQCDESETCAAQVSLDNETSTAMKIRGDYIDGWARRPDFLIS